MYFKKLKKKQQKNQFFTHHRKSGRRQIKTWLSETPPVIFLLEGQWNARQLFTRPVICMWAKQSCWETRLLSILMRKEALQKAGRTSCLCCSSHSPQQQSSEKHLLLGWWGRNWSQPWDMKPVPSYTTAEPTASPDRSFCLETTIRGLTRASRSTWPSNHSHKLQITSLTSDKEAESQLLESKAGEGD